MIKSSINEINAAVNLDLKQSDSAIKSSLGQQDFLRLVIGEIQNSDLIQAQEKKEFLIHLTQFGTNDGIARMQKSLQSNQALQASALVGRKVYVNSNYFALGAQSGIEFFINLPDTIDNAQISIYTELDELVNFSGLEHCNAGVFKYQWNGMTPNNQRAAAGIYKVNAKAFAGKQELVLTTMTSANVNSVSFGQGKNLKLNVDGFGLLSLDQIRFAV